MTDIPEDLRDRLDAAAFRRLLSHLDNNKDVQNIDLMILANFCRNCLGDWYRDAAAEHGLDISKDDARARVYGMPYAEWKEKHQRPVSEEKMAAFNARRSKD